MIRDIHEVTECPDCASSNIMYETKLDQIICRECGLIYEPLTPVEEERYERAHDLTMPQSKAPKAVKKVTKRRKR
jgi:transcription initiation factor TFIIIB Brf1 subunit/transcription initiation factor TFIIB